MLPTDQITTARKLRLGLDGLTDAELSNNIEMLAERFNTTTRQIIEAIRIGCVSMDDFDKRFGR